MPFRVLCLWAALFADTAFPNNGGDGRFDIYLVNVNKAAPYPGAGCEPRSTYMLVDRKASRVDKRRGPRAGPGEDRRAVEARGRLDEAHAHRLLPRPGRGARRGAGDHHQQQRVA